MTRLHPQSSQINARELQEMPPPPEPRVAYPEPQLTSRETIALIRGKTFLAAKHTGDIWPPGHPNVGFFHDDTRYLSRLELIVNGYPPTVLSSTTSGAYATRAAMTVRGAAHGEGLDIPVNTVFLRREQVLEDGTLDDVFELQNFYKESVRLKIDVTYDADFMDIFQVRGIVREKSGTYYTPIEADDRMIFLYKGLDDVLRSTTISFHPRPRKIAGKTASWDIQLAPFGRAQIRCAIVPRAAEKDAAASASEHLIVGSLQASAANRNVDEALGKLDHDFEAWQHECTRFRSDNDVFDRMLRTSIQDFYALQMRQPDGRALAAGVPWFAALFGRDSLIGSYETLILNQSIAKGTLKVLAAHQGRSRSNELDEDPGKILHEMRSGEMTTTGEVAFGMSYGSVDATPLFIIVLSEYIRWSGDTNFLREMQPHLTAAIQWLLEFGDLDGDGLIEYCRRDPKGLFNQGWKDSGDANLHADGRIAEPPIALIEVQGYASDALARASALYRILGLAEKATTLAERSQQLRQQFDQAMWLPKMHYYAMALDRDKKPLEVMASNPGHLLFANAVDTDRAAAVVKALMGHGLNSGWGIRTLSQEELTFNPMSYHRGSVWPHDNALIAYGMAVYGFHEESSRLCTALYDAALHFRDYRLPELFCGIQRSRRDEPVQYPVSCSPQAWASGALFLIFTALLGIRVDALNREIKIVNPHLPDFLKELAIDGLRVGSSRVWLEFLRQGKRTFCNVAKIEGEEISISVVYR
jgi:glycogen debranching enzyme